MQGPDWSSLRAELAIWNRDGLRLPFWWRDDDAIAPTKGLETLAGMALEHDIPVHLAIIPAMATTELSPFLTGQHLRGVVHGWSHRNTAPRDLKRSEFGVTRPNAAAELHRGLRHLQRLYGTAISPMFVPPWNRIAPEYHSVLADAGYTALSTYLPRPTFHRDGVVLINTHIDPIDWSGTRSLCPTDRILSRLVDNLKDRRAGKTDACEPLGLLTHHLSHDPAIWEFTHALLSELRLVSLDVFDITTTQELP